MLMSPIVAAGAPATLPGDGTAFALDDISRMYYLEK
jgi:hypothetical protein